MHGMLPDMPIQNLPQSLQAYEPNWFLSTTVQSTAALVAITSGFLISRLISTLSEKSGHLHRLGELEKRRQITVDAIVVQRRRIQSQTNAWFFDEKLDEVIKSAGTMDAKNLVSDFYASGYDESLTYAYAENMLNITKRAYKDISKIYGIKNPPPTTANELRGAGFQIQGYEEEVIYEKVAEKIASLRNVRGALNSLLVQAPIMDLGNVISSHEIRQHDAQIAKESDLLSSLTFIKAEIEFIESRLPSLTDPKRFIWGFIVLAYFAGIGIFYPLYYMTKNPVLAPANIRMNVYVGFLSGFIILLLYIADEVLKLRFDKFSIRFTAKRLRPKSK